MTRTLLLATIGLTLLSAAGTVAQDDPVRPRDPDWTAPASAARLVNPLSTAPADVSAGGRKLFADRCSTCHAADGRGTADAPDLGSPAVQAQTDGALFWKISSGNTRTGMPTFSFLPAPQRWQLVLHLRTLPAGVDRSRGEGAD